MVLVLEKYVKLDVPVLPAPPGKDLPEQPGAGQLDGASTPGTHVGERDPVGGGIGRAMLKSRETTKVLKAGG